MRGGLSVELTRFCVCARWDTYKASENAKRSILRVNPRTVACLGRQEGSFRGNRWAS